MTPADVMRRQAQFTQDAEHLATCTRKLWNTLWSMGVFTQLASNIKGFARKCASRPERALKSQRIRTDLGVSALRLEFRDELQLVFRIRWDVVVV